jgi:hypothetical protein
LVSIAKGCFHWTFSVDMTPRSGRRARGSRRRGRARLRSASPPPLRTAAVRAAAASRPPLVRASRQPLVREPSAAGGRAGSRPRVLSVPFGAGASFLVGGIYCWHLSRNFRPESKFNDFRPAAHDTPILFVQSSCLMSPGRQEVDRCCRGGRTLDGGLCTSGRT